MGTCADAGTWVGVLRRLAREDRSRSNFQLNLQELHQHVEEYPGLLAAAGLGLKAELAAPAAALELLVGPFPRE